MRLVAWNCAQRAHDKLEALLSLRPDVAVIPECAHPEVLLAKAPQLGAPWGDASIDWVGESRQKGLAVIAFGPYRLERAAEYRADLRHFLPVRVTGPESCNLLATWAFMPGPGGPAAPNSPALVMAVEHYREFLSAPFAVMAGDFNGGLTFDTPRRPLFGALVQALERVGLRSSIHRHRGWAFGQEPEPTFFDRSRQDLPFHLDYVFCNRDAAHVRAASVGARVDWRRLSDHMPLVVEWHPTELGSQ